MDFPGFEAADFELFTIPDFPGRMGAIRSQLKPKLMALGESLAPEIERITGVLAVPHVAQHMRRRVNPPPETWVAFTRDRKGYKRWTHYRVAAREAGIRVTVFVEDDSDDKALFGSHLQKRAAEIHKALANGGPVMWYTLGETPTPHVEASPKQLAEIGRSLQRLKTLKFQAGVPLAAREAVAMAPDAFEEWVRRQVELLKPLYLAGVP
jgi:uncharacterized protein YktB (UPF0637 family)